MRITGFPAPPNNCTDAMIGKYQIEESTNEFEAMLLSPQAGMRQTKP